MTTMRNKRTATPIVYPEDYVANYDIFMPECSIEETPDGVLHKMGWHPITHTNQLEGLSATDMTLDAQIKSGCKIEPSVAIKPNGLDAAHSALIEAVDVLCNPNNLSSIAKDGK